MIPLHSSYANFRVKKSLETERELDLTVQAFSMYIEIEQYFITDYYRHNILFFGNGNRK